jgi:hypothetical protein
LLYDDIRNKSTSNYICCFPSLAPSANVCYSEARLHPFNCSSVVHPPPFPCIGPLYSHFYTCRYPRHDIISIHPCLEPPTTTTLSQSSWLCNRLALIPRRHASTSSVVLHRCIISAQEQQCKLLEWFNHLFVGWLVDCCAIPASDCQMMMNNLNFKTVIMALLETADEISHVERETKFTCFQAHNSGAKDNQAQEAKWTERTETTADTISFFGSLT